MKTHYTYLLTLLSLVVIISQAQVKHSIFTSPLSDFQVTRDHYLYHKSLVDATENDNLPYLQDIHFPIAEPILIYTNVQIGLSIYTGLSYADDSLRLIFYHHTNEIKSKL